MPVRPSPVLKSSRYLRGLAAILLLGLLRPLAAALPEPVARELAKAGIPESSVGVWVQKIGERGPELAHQADRAMTPASLMKLVTTFAAFDALGPEHTWKTRVFADAEPLEGALAGNLYIVGEGDPALSLERLWRLLRGLRRQGLESIRGNVVLDHSAWQLPPFDPDAFDGKGTRPYNIGPDPLLINFAALRLSILPVPAGGPPTVLADPSLDGVTVRSELASGKGACGDWDDRLAVALDSAERAPVIHVGGEWRDSCGPRDWYVAPMTPAAYARGVVGGLWKELGGRLEGQVVDGVTPAEARLLAVDESPPLAEVARDMNKWSNNVQARLLLATLGAGAGSHPDTIAAGARVVAQRLADAGIDTASLVVENGSGLSRIEAISAATLGQILDKAYGEPWMPEFIASMALVGIDGTARQRLSGSPVRGQAHIKTGSLTGARSIAGYVLDRNGQRHVMVMLVNDPRAGASRDAQDALLEWTWHGAPAFGEGSPAARH